MKNNFSQPLVSVIIPCFNQGIYIEEAVNSVLNQKYTNYEIIIVNDGSTDEFTNKLLENYKKPNTKVYIHKENQGLSNTRNFAISKAQGKYILPLDADDKIHENYLKLAVEKLESDPELGIVYCEAEFFGIKNEKWNLPEYSFPDILLGNKIFCSAFYKKSDWEKTSGYFSEMKDGLEDYEFWLSLIELGVKVYRIPEILFYYRIKTESLSTQLDNVKREKIWNTIFNKHKDLYEKNIGFILNSIHIIESERVNTENYIKDLKNQISLNKNLIYKYFIKVKNFINKLKK